MNRAVSNALGMFFNAFIAGLVATVIPAIIAGIDASTGVFNITWQIISATITVNALTALVLGLNEYVRTNNSPMTRSLPQERAKGFLPFY